MADDQTNYGPTADTPTWHGSGFKFKFSGELLLCVLIFVTGHSKSRNKSTQWRFELFTDSKSVDSKLSNNMEIKINTCRIYGHLNVGSLDSKS